jgi:hypothetical protein
MWGRGIKKGGGDSLETFGTWRTFIWSVKEKNEKRNM